MVHSLFSASLIYNGEEDVGSDKLFQKIKIRSEKELARHKAKKAPYETIFIVCEDSKSLPNYLNEIIKYFRLNTANVRIIPSKGSAPISVVEHSIEIARTTPGIDRIVCIFDRDKHESYQRAIKKLNDHKSNPEDKSKPVYQTIVSTPCYEIWLLLHFSYTTKAYSSSGKKSASENVTSDLEKKLPLYNKKTVKHWFNDLIDKLDTAIKHAKQLQEHNDKTNSINPATNIHELIEHLRNLKNFNNN